MHTDHITMTQDQSFFWVMQSKPKNWNEFPLAHSCGFLVTLLLDTHKGTFASMH